MAGLPAAARAVREAAQAGFLHCAVTVPDLWVSDPVLAYELRRLAGDMTVELGIEAEVLAASPGDTLVISGERLITAAALTEARAGRPVEGTGGLQQAAQLRDGGGPQGLARAARRIIVETAKPGDGIVSRHINRPISQAISRLLLRWDSVRPVHGTWGTGIIGLVMLGFLLSGTQLGLIVGAILFQAASIFDGVDGEIARATFRSTPQGARLDSLIDAATNIGCLGGVALNLYMQGETWAAFAGAAGIAMLAAGLTLIGQRTRSSAQGLNFNAVKEHFNKDRSRLMTWLTWLTMRDFFAFVGAIVVIAGFAGYAMFAFAVIAAGWLVVVLTVMTRQAT